MKKELSFWERIFGFYNESRHRVICLFGLKIKIRSKYLMLRNRVNEQELAFAVFRRDFTQLRKDVALHRERDAERAAAMISRVAKLESQIQEQKSLITSLSDELIAFRKEQAAQHKNYVSDIAKLKEALAVESHKLREEMLKSVSAAQKQIQELMQKGQMQGKQIDDMAKAHSLTISKLSKVDAALGALEKRSQWVRTDMVNRVATTESKLRYMIHKYCPDEKRAEALKDWYRGLRGKELSLENPQTYNEKIQWMKLYDSTPIKTMLADKYLVRDWVAERIGEQYLIPLLGVWDSFDEIDFDALPEQFVLKCNHGSGYNLIVKNKSELNLDEVRRKVNAWLAEDFSFRAGFELHYSPIPRKIIAEKYIENLSVEEGKADLVDYKFWCFEGKTKYVALISGRGNQGGATMAFYDSDWNKQNFTSGFPLSTTTAVRPDNLEEMIAVAEKLAADFNHVRVDLYRMDDGRIYFGEMTFTTASGVCKWQPVEMDAIMGQLLQLPTMRRETDS